MHVQPLGLESGESAGHREELFAHRGEMVQPLLQTEVGQVIGAGLVAQIGRELLVLLDEGVAIVGAEDVMAMLDLLDDRVQLALQFFGDALPGYTQIRAQILGGKGQTVSHPDVKRGESKHTETLANKGDSHCLAEPVATCQMERVKGIEPTTYLHQLAQVCSCEQLTDWCL